MKAGVQRRRWILTIAAIAFASAAGAADPNKILRVAANDIDTLAHLGVPVGMIVPGASR